MLKEHLDYVADSTRLALFRAAVRQSISPNSSVADIGCGSGVLGLLCLQAGAGRVYAIDDSIMLEVARETLARAGYGEQTTFIQGRSGQIELPERVDMVICDHVGYFGFDYSILELLKDARRRFLKPGGRLVPSRIRLCLAPVGSEKCQALAEGWLSEVIPPEFHWLRRHSINTKHAVDLERRDVLGMPGVLGDIDLGTENPDFFSWSVELQATRSSVMHGLAGWFECELAHGIWMTNSPLAEKPIRRPQAFFPLGDEVSLRPGDVMHATIMARPADDLIAWIVEFPSTGKRYSHSTWQGMLLSKESLVRTNPAYVPKLGRVGQAHLTVLGYCDGKRTAREIEEAVARDHPHLFPSRDEIAYFVSKVLGRDCL